MVLGFVCPWETVSPTNWAFLTSRVLSGKRLGESAKALLSIPVVAARICARAEVAVCGGLPLGETDWEGGATALPITLSVLRSDLCRFGC